MSKDGVIEVHSSSSMLKHIHFDLRPKLDSKSPKQWCEQDGTRHTLHGPHRDCLVFFFTGCQVQDVWLWIRDRKLLLCGFLRSTPLILLGKLLDGFDPKISLESFLILSFCRKRV